MAHVPNFVKLAGYKGRSDLSREAAQGDAILTWVTTDAELESDSPQDIEGVAEQLRTLKASGQSVELELMELANGIKPKAGESRTWTETAGRSAKVQDVRFDPDHKELVVDLRLERG